MFNLMKKTLFSAVLATAFGIGALAQEPMKLLTFENALHMTLQDNPQITALQYEEIAAEQNRKAVSGLRYPQINVGATYTHLGKDIAFDLNSAKVPIQQFATGLIGSLVQQGIQFPTDLLLQSQQLFGSDWKLNIQDKDQAIVGGTVTMPLFMGGKINAANRAAEIDRKTVLEQGTQSRNALVSELVERYYGLVLAREVVEVRRQVVDGMRLHLENAIRLEQNGVIAKGERLYAEVKMAEAERELKSSQMQVQTIVSALSNTLNSSEEYIPVSAMFILDRIEDVAYFKEAALSNNPLLKQVALKKELAEEGVKVKRADFMPQLALMGGASFYNWQTTELLPRWAVGATLSINIFDGLSKERKFNAAKNTVRQVEALQTKAGSDISVLIEKLYNQLQDYRDQIPSIETSLAFAEEYLRIKEAAFREGMASSADVVDARLNLAKIKTERLQAAYNYDLMLAQLLEAAGISNKFLSYSQSNSMQQIVFE